MTLPPWHADAALGREIRQAARPLADARDLDPLLERVGDARVVMLGEASHGTSEYYSWRARITQRLLRERGFSFVAVEGDWPDCFRVSRFVKGLPSPAGAAASTRARDVLDAFERWPASMWANWETVALDAGVGDALLLSHELGGASSAPRGHRAIGVVYDPAHDEGAGPPATYPWGV